MIDRLIIIRNITRAENATIQVKTTVWVRRLPIIIITHRLHVITNNLKHRPPMTTIIIVGISIRAVLHIIVKISINRQCLPLGRRQTPVEQLMVCSMNNNNNNNTDFRTHRRLRRPDFLIYLHTIQII